MAYVRRDDGWVHVPGPELDVSGRPRYPWDEWADGSLWFVRRFDDYLGMHADVVTAARSYARYHRKTVDCEITTADAYDQRDPGGVMIRFTHGPELCTGGLNGGPLPHSRMCTPCAGRDVCRYKP